MRFTGWDKMPEYPPFATLHVTELVGIAQPTVTETPSLVEAHGRVQRGWGSPEEPTRSEVRNFVQNPHGSPESPARSESVSFSQA